MRTANASGWRVATCCGPPFDVCGLVGRPRVAAHAVRPKDQGNDLTHHVFVDAREPVEASISTLVSSRTSRRTPS